MAPCLFDLVEYRFDHARRAFVKAQTRLYNQPAALCYGEKKKIRPVSRFTRFKVVPNGEKQYSNQF